MQNQILYWRGASDLQVDLIKEFKARGFAIKHARTIEDVLKSVTTNTIIIADANSGSPEAIQKANELALAEQLHAYPLMFICADAPKRAEPLRGLYKRLLAVSTPFKADAIFAQVSNLGGTPAPVTDDVAPTRQEEPKSDLPPVIEVAVPSPPRPLDLISRGNSLRDFDDKKLLPAHPKQSLIKQALDRLTQLDEWAGIHSRRVATISSVFSEQLELAPERDVNIRTVALLLNWGLNSSGGESRFSPTTLRKFDIFRDWGESDTIHEIASGFERTAEFLRVRIEDPMASETVRAIASFMRSDDAVIPSYVAEDAQVALLNEFTDRACWANGHWDPRGAHRVIKGLRSGVPFFIEGMVKEIVLQMLVDAIVARESLLAHPLPSMKQEISQDELSDAERQVHHARTVFREQPKQIELSALRPGMVLLRPIISKAGAIILPSNVKLDDDLILRLWQLSALVPFRLPLWILSET